MKRVRTRCRSPQPKLLKATRLNVRSGAKNARSRQDSKCHRLPRRCRHRLDGLPREPPTTATGSRRPATGVTTSCRPRSQYADLEESLPSVRGRSRSFGCGALAGGGSGGKPPSPLQKTHAHGGSTLPGQMPSQSRDHHQRRRRRDLRDATASASADAPERVSMDDTRCGDGVRRTSLHSLAPGVPRTRLCRPKPEGPRAALVRGHRDIDRRIGPSVVRITPPPARRSNRRPVDRVSVSPPT